MAELSRIQTQKRIVCPHCQQQLSDDDLEIILDRDEGLGPCPYCGGQIRLPAEMVKKHQESKYIGLNLDIVG